MRKALLAGTGGVLAAILGSLCCVGPLVFVALGVGAGLAGTFEPLRPVFGGLMVVMLGLGFYTVYGKRRAGADEPLGESSDGAACAVPRAGIRDRVILWSAAVLAIVLWSFPAWSPLFI